VTLEVVEEQPPVLRQAMLFEVVEWKGKGMVDSDEGPRLL
jgi:hypothetical protein